MGAVPGTSLQGDLYIYPFRAEERPILVANQYEELLEHHNHEAILCLTRLCSEQDLTDEIVTTIDDVGYPTVTTFTSYATDALQALDPGLEFLSDHERIELLAEFLTKHDWETEYLARAAHQESFQQDVGELLIEMESRNVLDPEAYQSSILQEIASVGAQFRSQLDADGYLDRPSLLPCATTELETAISDDTVPKSISRWEVILIADFEELARIERRFLQAISEAADASIIALAERQSRILSSWREAGGLELMADGLNVTVETANRDSLTAPAAIGEYLVTGNCPYQDIDNRSVQIIEASTFREQLTQVADEIESLCRTNNYAYSDITIAYQDSSAPVEQTIRLLRRHGIPTTTVSVTRLGHDPAVRELYDVAKVCDNTTDEEERWNSRDRLLELNETAEEYLSEVQTTSTAATGLWEWIGRTQLKHRIGSGWDEIEARDQFRRVQEVVELAEFLESEPRLDGSWAEFRTALERAFRYSSTRLDNIEPDWDEGGVPVGTVYGLKHSDTKVVFLLNVTDQEYPFTPDLAALLPTPRLEKETQFPMLTAPSSEDITATFRPASDTAEDPFHAYFAQVSRRLLGIGACAASDRLYLGIPRESTDSLGTYHQPSRFLSDLVDTFDFIEPLKTDEGTAIMSHGGASEFVVEHVEDTLEAVRRASVGGDTVDLDTYERELAAIETLLDNPEAGTVQEALEARIDFRHGRVYRD